MKTTMVAGTEPHDQPSAPRTFREASKNAKGSPASSQSEGHPDRFTRVIFPNLNSGNTVEPEATVMPLAVRR
jgi:hypothetical protein